MGQPSNDLVLKSGGIPIRMFLSQMADDHSAGRPKHPRRNGETLAARFCREDLDHFVIEHFDRWPSSNDSSSDRSF